MSWGLTKPPSPQPTPVGTGDARGDFAEQVRRGHVFDPGEDPTPANIDHPDFKKEVRGSA